LRLLPLSKKNFSTHDLISSSIPRYLDGEDRTEQAAWSHKTFRGRRPGRFAMMPKKTIRIIKSAERRSEASANKSEATETARSASGGVTAQVATWVKEFQQRRRPDPRRAFASLFAADTTAPLNSLS
jgi:hypothetical protein